MLRASGMTDRGRIRPTNEDCFGIDPALQLCVVADGMGGHNAGEVASRMAVEAVLDYVANNAVTTTWPYGYDSSVSERSNLLRTAVQVANARVFEASANSPAYAGMGTTIVAVLLSRNVLTIAHVGDSRLYSLSEGHAEQLTSDDSWAAAMLARDPSLDPAVLKAHPMRNALTSVIGSRPQVDVHVAERTLTVDELLVLTTDGVHGVLGEAMLARACESTGDLQSIACRLVHAAITTGSRDNCTAVVARYETA
ncbi:MAG TPA: protein phosphatase 2C domain-containing protein [Vicinamibacterales bacterium]|nr:protein phosphatase 2C domain-containing protein [Vicinamibacterales bacterium]